MLNFRNYSRGAWETPKPLLMLHFLHSQTLPTPLLGTMKNPNPFSCFIFSLPKPFPPHSWEPWSTQPPFANPLLWTMKHPTPFSCFIFGLPRLFPPHSWEFMLHFEHSQALPAPLLGTRFDASCLAFPDPSHPTHGNHEAPKPFFMLHFEPSQALPTPHLGTMWNTQIHFHASFWAFPNPSHHDVIHVPNPHAPPTCFVAFRGLPNTPLFCSRIARIPIYRRTIT